MATTADDWVPANIEALAPYEPGKPVEELERELGISGAIKLASNENPLGPSPLGLAAAHEAMAGASRYPDGGGFRLRRALAAKLDVTPERIILGAGSNEIIDNLVRTFCRPGVDEVVTHRYAFMMYRVSCGAHGVAMREAEVTPELGCDVDALLGAVGPATRLVFLPNPNNPTGSYVRRPELERVVRELPPQVLLVVDEAYFEYARARPDYPDAMSLLAARPRMIVLRTFSKAYGLAAMRVGYGVADPRIVGYLNRVRMPFNVSTAAQEAARAALADDEHVARSQRVTADGMAQLAAGLAGLPVTLYDSAGNFVLVDLGRDVGPVYEALLRRGVIVRPLRPLGLPRHIRVTVGTREENERFLAALAAILAPP
jgi:histidinol-phosphate aminotransferase